MARNPKPVRRRYKAARAEVRRGTYKYPPPTYDQLNDRKPASVVYRVMCAASAAVASAGAAFRSLRLGLSRAAGAVRAVTLREPTRDDVRLVE